MDYWQALILGVIQGLTEFLPISSSGHLILLRDLLGINVIGGLAFDTVLHGATGLAVLIYFWKDIKALDIKKWGLIIIGIIPAIIFALLFEDTIEYVFRYSWLVAVALIVGSIVMMIGEWVYKRVQKVEEMTWKKALAIGFVQVLALIPGFSRSGMSISGGMMVGLSRLESARFSFLMLFPISVLAAGKQSLDLLNQGFLLGTDFTALAIGFASAFVFGLLAIHILIEFVKKYSMYAFVVYRILIALLVLIFLV